MCLNAIKVSRKVHTFCDVLGHVGGFQSVLFTMCSTIISIFTHKKSLNHLLDQLFKTNDSEVSEAIDPKTNKVQFSINELFSGMHYKILLKLRCLRHQKRHLLLSCQANFIRRNGHCHTPPLDELLDCCHQITGSLRKGDSASSGNRAHSC